jgi:CDP-paratose 2-epimerase
MDTILITGSCGLIGSESVLFFAEKGFKTVGIDNNMRRYFYGDDGDTSWRLKQIQEKVPDYCHYDVDFRNEQELTRVFEEHGPDIGLIIHAGAQPSHDWAANEPITDFTINANGTLLMLEMTRCHCPGAVFIFTSTNKVYGDTPNQMPLIERDKRWELQPEHRYAHHGIDESMSIDQSTHSVFGASKLSADVMVQEYGKYFDIKSACFRGGCLTGPGHSGAKLHGFLSYLVKCGISGHPYEVLGYKGKQVRDNIHSFDFVNAMFHFYQNPRCGEVYNMGGSRHSNCSILEAIEICEKLTGKSMNWSYNETNRIGDHIWWISDVRKFQGHFPDWNFKYDIEDILEEICSSQTS